MVRTACRGIKKYHICSDDEPVYLGNRQLHLNRLCRVILVILDHHPYQVLHRVQYLPLVQKIRPDHPFQVNQYLLH